MRTLPDPFGIPGPLVHALPFRKDTPEVLPSRLRTRIRCGFKPFRSEAGALCAPAKWQRTAPRFRESPGGAQPARRKNRFIRPPWRPNVEILPQSAGPDNPESRSGAYRGTWTIAIQPYHRTFFTTEHTESGFAGHRRRLKKDVVPILQPQPCQRGGTRSVASCRRSLPVCQRGATTHRGGTRSVASAHHPTHIHISHRSGIGPARDVPAPPSARGVRTRLP